MQLFKSRFAAWTAVAALGAASVFAAQTSSAPFQARGHGRGAAFLSNYLNLTDAQKTLAQSIFEGARQSAQPVRQQLAATRQALHAAVQSGDSAQIQQLSTTEGSQLGQLAVIRSSAMSKVYQSLTPDQQQKFDQLEQARKTGRQAGAAIQN